MPSCTRYCRISVNPQKVVVWSSYLDKSLRAKSHDLISYKSGTTGNPTELQVYQAKRFFIFIQPQHELHDAFYQGGRIRRLCFVYCVRAGKFEGLHSLWLSKAAQNSSLRCAYTSASERHVQERCASVRSFL